MEILSYPIGLVIGLFPVIVDLNGQPGPARLLLDGRQVCEVSARAPACMIDIGPDPRVRSLDLERLDAKGRVVERIRRWINRPAAEAKIRAVGSCDDKRGQCEFQLQWAHPSKLEPSSVTVSLDGNSVRKGDDPLVRFSFNPKRPPQVLTVEAVFPDGQRADFTQLLHGGSYPEKAEASLHPVPLEVAPGDAGHDLEARLRNAGWKVRAVDEGETEILFVLQPKAISRYASATSEISRNPAMFGGALEGLGPIWFIVADESLSLMQPTVVGEHEKRWLPALITMSSRASLARIRTADAVAAGGYRLGGVPRRRIMVLVLGPRDFFEPDSSALSSAQVLEYLRRVGVPLVVWRMEIRTSGTPPPALANLAREKWPDGEWIHTSHDFPRAIARLRDVIDRQRLVWLEEAVDTSVLEPLLPAGVKLAGSAKSRDAAAESQEHPLAAAARIVYAAAPDPAEPQAIYAGTAEGLLRSRDAGVTWVRVETGNVGGVFSLAFAGEGRARLLAGGSGALFRSIPEEPGWSGLSLPAVFALGVDPSNPSMLYAGTRGRVFKSTDGGLEWFDASTGIAATFALALAVDPKNSATVYAGTAGSGVFKSSDAGKTWHPSGAELQGTAVRSLAVNPDNPSIVYAGTDGGVFLSTDAGRFWKTAGTGLPRAITYALAIDPGNRERIFAGTASGLFVSEHGGSYWKRCPALKTPVASLAFDAAGGRLIAGTLGEGVVAVKLEGLETEPDEGTAANMPEQERGGVTAGIPPGLLPSTATGPELPLKVVLSNPRWNQNRSKVSALLRVTVGIEPILETIAKTGRARMLLNVLSESPTASRSSLARLERTLPYDAAVDNWTLEVPITWSSRATRLFVTIVEAETGAHAGAAVDPARLE